MPSVRWVHLFPLQGALLLDLHRKASSSPSAAAPSLLVAVQPYFPSSRMLHLHHWCRPSPPHADRLHGGSGECGRPEAAAAEVPPDACGSTPAPGGEAQA
jgi:hypothetical protein